VIDGQYECSTFIYYLFAVADQLNAKGFLTPAPIDMRFSTKETLNFCPLHGGLGFPDFRKVLTCKAKLFYFADRFSKPTPRVVCIF